MLAHSRQHYEAKMHFTSVSIPKNLEFFLMLEEGSSILHSVAPEHREHISVFMVHVYPYWRLKCHARQTYCVPLSLWRIPSIHFFPAMGVPYSLWVWSTSVCLRCMNHSGVLCSGLFVPSPETHASMKGRDAHCLYTQHLTWTRHWVPSGMSPGLTVLLLTRVTSLPSAKVFPRNDILGIDSVSHIQICELSC